jgi:transposase
LQNLWTISIIHVIISPACSQEMSMQGEQTTQDGLFVYGSLDSLVPADDRYRRLDALLDLAWVRRETRHLYSWTGRPSVDPVVIAKLLLIAYFEGITSERELLRQVQVNLAFRRFIGYRLDEPVPDHSSLSRARYRLGQPFFRRLFEHVLRLCLDAGLVGGEHQSIDSTVVQANASLASLRPRLVPAVAQEFTERVFRENPVDEEVVGSPRPPRKPATTRNRDYVSRTDPDSGLMARKTRTARLGYLVHYSVDRLKKIVTGVRTVAAHVPDAGQLVPLVDALRARALPVRSVAADKGYSTGEVYESLHQRGILAFIPLPRKGGRGLFRQEAFRYEVAQDQFRCPNGAALTLRQVRQGQRKYRPRPRDCAACPLRSRCTRGQARTLTISRYHAYLQEARRLQGTAAAKRAAVARRTGPENLFSEAKGQHGLSRARYRGLANMEQQALLTATVQNLKRYLQAETRVTSGAAALRAALPALPSTLLRSFRRLSRSFLCGEHRPTVQATKLPV